MSRNKSGLLLIVVISLSVLLHDLIFAQSGQDALTQSTGRIICILIFGGITELYIRKRNAQK